MVMKSITVGDEAKKGSKIKKEYIYRNTPCLTKANTRKRKILDSHDQGDPAMLIFLHGNFGRS